MKTWREFWDGDHAIYVNERHKAAHAAGVLADVSGWLPGNNGVVLDFGCGEARYAEALAEKCGTLLLCEAADGVRQALAERLAGNDRCRVLAPDDIGDLAAGSIDLIVVNSVIQYLETAEFEAFLDVWRRGLKADGRLILADVIPPDVSALEDAMALLRFGWREGFAIAAGFGLVRTFLSDYRTIRRQLGLRNYEAGQLIDILARHRLGGRRVAKNFGHNPQRFTVVAEPV